MRFKLSLLAIIVLVSTAVCAAEPTEIKCVHENNYTGETGVYQSVSLRRNEKNLYDVRLTVHLTADAATSKKEFKFDEIVATDMVCQFDSKISPFISACARKVGGKMVSAWSLHYEESYSLSIDTVEWEDRIPAMRNRTIEGGVYLMGIGGTDPHLDLTVKMWGTVFTSTDKDIKKVHGCSIKF